MTQGTHGSGQLPGAAYAAAIILALLGVGAAVFTNASESQLVMLSYALVPLAVFGIAGLALGRRLRPAVISAVLALAGLFLFMQVIFPRL